jgi:hypothetical protein
MSFIQEIGDVMPISTSGRRSFFHVLIAPLANFDVCAARFDVWTNMFCEGDIPMR